MSESGTLYLVATPIGNLQDITFRAIETLKSVDIIYAEDTRRTKQLLATYEINKPLYSFHQHSPDSLMATIVCALKDGENVAYVTDAGTPGLADPGGKLVDYVRMNSGSVIIPIPGPSAVTALLSVAGFPANSFYFAGYVPTKKGRQTFIKKVIATEETVVLFETAPRLLKLLDQLIEFGGQGRLMVIGRELTKQFEDIQFGLPGELKDWYTSHPLKGELVIALGPIGYK